MFRPTGPDVAGPFAQSMHSKPAQPGRVPHTAAACLTGACRPCTASTQLLQLRPHWRERPQLPNKVYIGVQPVNFENSMVNGATVSDLMPFARARCHEQLRGPCLPGCCKPSPSYHLCALPWHPLRKSQPGAASLPAGTAFWATTIMGTHQTASLAESREALASST